MRACARTEVEADTTRRRIYVDTRLQYMLQLSFDVPFFTRGDFPAVVDNGTTPIVLENPWVNGTRAAPFDQRTCHLARWWCIRAGDDADTQRSI